jgi:hypothetical protein
MKLTLPILAISATMFASSASAFDPDDLQKLKDTNGCVGCDLRDANLKDAELAYTARKDAIFCNTTMTNGSVDNSGC